MKILLVGAESFHAEGQTDARKLIVAFANFLKEPKNRSNTFRPAERGGHNLSLLLLSPPNIRSKQRMELIALELYFQNEALILSLPERHS